MTFEPSGKLDQLLDAARGGHQVAVHELDALRRARRARGVDQRGLVLGLDGAPGGLDVDVGLCGLDVLPAGGALAAGALEHDHRLQRGQIGAGALELLREVLLDDRHLRARVGDHVGDLLGRGGRVDRERRRAERHHGEVGDVELGPVDEHQRHRVAAPDAELVQAAGERVDAVAQLAPGQRHLVVLGAHGDAVGVVLRGDAEGFGDRGGADGARRRPGFGGGPHGREPTSPC